MCIISGAKWPKNGKKIDFGQEGQKSPVGSMCYTASAATRRQWQRFATPNVLLDNLLADGKDEISISADGNPFYPGRSAWYDAGSAELTPGKHVITWYLGGLKEKDRYGGMDCFVLTTGAFAPNGKYKPGEQSPQPTPAFQPGQAWDFVPAADKLDPSALLDLRCLNEKVAGEHGFVRLSADGNSFVWGDGRPIRFWAASSASAPQFDLASQKHSAQFLAKRGVNLMRLGDNSLIPTAPGSKITDVNEKALDEIFKGVAATLDLRVEWKKGQIGS